ncbi:phage holin [Anaerotruncus massiliensis (ex Togo et al. 2019)]
MQNPVVVVSVLVSVFNALTDPTTSGVNDSVRAMTYETPHKDTEAGNG